jgi:hypothetical protein
MMNQRLTIAGVAALVLGVLLLAGQSFVPGVSRVQALQADPTATSTSTSTVVTNTAVTIVRTSTPTFTSTALPQTATPVPPTTAPPAKPNTPASSSGNEGVAVKPPNTGSGGSTGGDLSIWLLVLGAASVAAGSGAVFVGTRRR